MTFSFVTGVLVERSAIPIKEFPDDPENEVFRDARHWPGCPLWGPVGLWHQESGWSVHRTSVEPQNHALNPLARARLAGFELTLYAFE